MGPVFSAMYLCYPEEIRCDSDRNKGKQVVGIPTKLSQELLEKEIPEEINIVFLELFPCLGFALTVKVILDK